MVESIEMGLKLEALEKDPFLWMRMVLEWRQASWISMR